MVSKSLNRTDKFFFHLQLIKFSASLISVITTPTALHANQFQHNQFYLKLNKNKNIKNIEK